MHHKCKKNLGSKQKIDNVGISMEPKGASIITTTEPLSVADLQKQLDSLSGYNITEINWDINLKNKKLKWKGFNNIKKMKKWKKL